MFYNNLSVLNDSFIKATIGVGHIGKFEEIAPLPL